MIRTVLGDIAPADLGFCNAHDHVLIRGGVGVLKNPGLDISDREVAERELTDYRDGGGGAIVDCMPLDCGRDAIGLVEVSRRAAVHIVAVTGFHTPHYYVDHHWSYELDDEAIAELLVAEVVDGMDRWGHGGPYVDRLAARAGAVKIATELDTIAPITDKIMRAAASCHLRTGAPILTHTERGTMALAQIERLVDLGVDASAILVSHVDRNVDPLLHDELARSGAYMIYDGPSRTRYHSVEEVADLIAVAAEAGATARILLGLDLALREYRSGYGGMPGFGFLLDVFVPLLRKRGFDESAIDAFGRRNPARAFDLRRVGCQA